MRTTRLLVALASVVALSGCELVASGPRVPGPYDPGQNDLPAAEVVTELCGGELGRRLLRASDSYVELYNEWERFQAYFEAVSDGGVNAEELSGLEDRRANMESAIKSHQRSLDAVRTSGGRVDGPSAARCDTEVIAVFETIVESKAPEISYVDTESAGMLAATSTNGA